MQVAAVDFIGWFVARQLPFWLLVLAFLGLCRF
jgi:hypothetical protein